MDFVNPKARDVTPFGLKNTAMDHYMGKLLGDSPSAYSNAKHSMSNAVEWRTQVKNTARSCADADPAVGWGQAK